MMTQPDAPGSHVPAESASDDGSEYPDMDAIRDAHNRPRPDVAQSTGSALVDAFRASMHLDYEKWHDGTGYDIDLLQKASATEHTRILSLLTPPNGWRDVQALAALGTDHAIVTLRNAFHSGSAEVRGAILRYAPTLVSDDDKTTLLVHALQHQEFYGGLTQALDHVAEFHPPRAINALIRGLFVRPGEIATHFAAMLWFIHGKSMDIFDWSQRPLFLEFNSNDGAERRAAFLKLCNLLGLDADATRAAAGVNEA